MRFADELRPDPRAPALAPVGIAFIDYRNGFLATTGGGVWVPKTAWLRPSQPGRIQRTTDGGVTWRTVWSRPGIVLTSLAVGANGNWQASGQLSPMTGRFGPTPTTAVTVSNGRVVRTRRIPSSAATPTIVRGRSGRTVYESDSPQDPDSPYGGTRIRRSDDGGRTWRTVLDLGPHRRWVTIERLGVVDPQHVWAVSHENDQGFDFFDVHVTDDGGRHWTRRRVPALPGAFARGGCAWAVDGGTAAVWRTLDEGRTWRISTSPLGVGVREIDVAAAHEVDVATSIGELRSTDGGTSWRAVPPPTQRASALRNGRLAFVPTNADYAERVLVRRGSGWAALQTPPGLFTFGDARFTDKRHGLVAGGDANGADVRARTFRTSDGGRTWTPVRLPPGANGQDEAALGPDTIVVEQDRRLFVTTDDGDHWSKVDVSLQYPECFVQRPAKTTWVLCTDVISQHAAQRSVLLRSDGHALRMLTTGRVFGRSFLATSDTDAWTVGQSSEPDTVAPLWHTTDGGSSWQRVAVAPPRDAAVVYRLPLPR